MRKTDTYRGKAICPVLAVTEMALSLVSQLPNLALQSHQLSTCLRPWALSVQYADPKFSQNVVTGHNFPPRDRY